MTYFDNKTLTLTRHLFTHSLQAAALLHKIVNKELITENMILVLLGLLSFFFQQGILRSVQKHC